VKEYKIGR